MPVQVHPRTVIAADFTIQRVYKSLALKFDEAGASHCTLVPRRPLLHG